MILLLGTVNRLRLFMKQNMMWTYIEKPIENCKCNLTNNTSEWLIALEEINKKIYRQKAGRIVIFFAVLFFVHGYLTLSSQLYFSCLVWIWMDIYTNNVMLEHDINKYHVKYSLFMTYFFLDIINDLVFFFFDWQKFLFNIYSIWDLMLF